MPSLHEVQREMRSRLLEGEDGAVAAWIVDGGWPAQLRLEVHRNTMLGRAPRPAVIEAGDITPF